VSFGKKSAAITKRLLEAGGEANARASLTHSFHYFGSEDPRKTKSYDNVTALEYGQSYQDPSVVIDDSMKILGDYDA
jgi:hypothetical protein